MVTHQCTWSSHTFPVEFLEKLIFECKTLSNSILWNGDFIRDFWSAFHHYFVCDSSSPNCKTGSKQKMFCVKIKSGEGKRERDQALSSCCLLCNYGILSVKKKTLFFCFGFLNSLLFTLGNLGMTYNYHARFLEQPSAPLSVSSSYLSYSPLAEVVAARLQVLGSFLLLDMFLANKPGLGSLAYTKNCFHF